MTQPQYSTPSTTRLLALSSNLSPVPTLYKRKVWVTKTVDAYDFTPFSKNLSGKTIVISGASRGIGLAIGKKAAKDGANIVILAKTAETHPKLPGTIYSAAKEIEELGGKALPLICDVRNEENIKECIKRTIETFGGIDILINNASAISLTGTLETDMKRYDLMHSINTRGTFLLSKYCIPHLLKSKNPHILNISPPLNMDSEWFAPHVAYTMAKYGMSMCVLGMSQEFKDEGIAVNALWPRTSISTAAVNNLLGAEQTMRISRNEEIMADAAYIIFNSSSKSTTGNFFLDDEVLASVGITNLEKYKVVKEIHDKDLMPDFFC